MVHTNLGGKLNEKIFNNSYSCIIVNPIFINNAKWWYFKKTSVNGMNIPETIQLAVDDIKSENWNAANEKSENLSNTWDKVVKRIQYSSERDEINSFNTSIAHLKGAIAAQDKSASLMALNEAYEHWDGVGK